MMYNDISRITDIFNKKRSENILNSVSVVQPWCTDFIDDQGVDRIVALLQQQNNNLFRLYQVLAR